MGVVLFYSMQIASDSLSCCNMPSIDWERPTMQPDAAIHAGTQLLFEKGPESILATYHILPLKYSSGEGK